LSFAGDTEETLQGQFRKFAKALAEDLPVQAPIKYESVINLRLDGRV